MLDDTRENRGERVLKPRKNAVLQGGPVRIVLAGGYTPGLRERATRDTLVYCFGRNQASIAIDSDRLKTTERLAGQHCWRPTGSEVRIDDVEQGSACLSIAFDRALTNQILEEASPPAGAALDEHFIAASGRALSSVARSARDFVRLNGDPGRLALESLAVLALTACVGERTGTARPPTSRGGLAPARLRSVEEYIEAHLDADLSLTRLALLSGMSVTRFSKAFREETGMTPHRFVVMRRLARAQDLLRGGSLSLSQIAYETGFASQSHMTMVFRRLLNTTPGAVRRGA